MPILIFSDRMIQEVVIPGEAPLIEAEEVTSLSATGEELAIILSSCPGLPRFIGRKHMRWFGDDARFIVGNLW